MRHRSRTAASRPRLESARGEAQTSRDESCPCAGAWLEARFRVLACRSVIHANRALLQRGDELAALRAVLVPAHIRIPACPVVAGRTLPVPPEDRALRAATVGGRSRSFTCCSPTG